MQDKPNDQGAPTATTADVAKVQDDLNTFKGSTDKAFASVWKAIGEIQKSDGSGGGAAADHDHVPVGHAPYADDRVTGPVADPSSKPTGKDAGQVVDETTADAAST